MAFIEKSCTPTFESVDSKQAPGSMSDRQIEDFALIGDLHTAALVSRGGAIEWLCVPRFDSPSAFASLLGDRNNGCWTLAPRDGVLESHWRYMPGTLVLENTLRTQSGSIQIIDFMPRREDTPTIVRIVKGVEGSVAMSMQLVCRFSYGYLAPWTRWIGEALTMTVGANAVALRSTIELRTDGPDTYAEFTIDPGAMETFVLQWYPSHQDPPDARDAIEAYRETCASWEEWSGRCAYQGAYREAVARSVITLKALMYEPTGGCVAAATTSLPEQLGGAKNWDYRFAWLRDSAITIEALVEGGYLAEARAWRDWLLRMLAGEPEKLQIMYSVSGEPRIEEYTIDWLRGYEGAVPVRIGNAAYTQFQLGIYGNTMEAIFNAHKAGIEIDRNAWEMLCNMLDYVCDHWRDPDSGIWELREKPMHYTHSRVMAWVAFDRAIKIVEAENEFRGPVDRWYEARSQIHDDVCRRGFSRRRHAFVQAYENHDLDASLLMIPLVGFLPIDHEYVVQTLRAIERDLMVDGFVMRMSRDIKRDALGKVAINEGSFLPCNFWLAGCYVLEGRLAEARALFERTAGVANDLGLLSEEYDPVRKRQVGNTPQTFSHATLVYAAMMLSKAVASAC
jgi:GH15 family glucan-1,4-alpha-glucosidase